MRNADKADEVAVAVSKLDNVPEFARVRLLRSVLSDAAERAVREAGVADEVLLRLAKGRTPMKSLAATLEGAADVRTGDIGDFLHDWRAAEQHLRDAYAAEGKYFPTGSGGRFVDACSGCDAVAGGVAREAKSGYVKNSAFVRRQIAKDRWLMDNRGSNVEWHFFPSARSQSVGASESVLQLLRDNDIPYVVHLP